MLGLILPLGALAAVLWALYRPKPMSGPVDKIFPLARLERSGTAERLGIENSIPPSLKTRALGLALVASYVERDLSRVTSAYRSADVTEAIYAAHGRDKPYPGGGPHGEARALDFGGSQGMDDPAELEKLAQKTSEHPVVGRALAFALVEGDHLHTEYDAETLERWGRDLAEGRRPDAELWSVGEA